MNGRSFVGLGMSMLGLLLMACSEDPAPDDAAPLKVLLGIETISDELPFYFPDAQEVRYPRPTDEIPDLWVLPSRERYWGMDGHLDVVVRLNTERTDLGDQVHMRISDAEGQPLSSAVIHPLPGLRFAVYPAIPSALSDGGHAVLETTWVRDGEVRAETRHPFRVERYPNPAPRSGHIPLRIANEEGVTGRQIPFTVGVPFPRGALADPANLRLIATGEKGDERDVEISLTVRETARWTRYGSIKWVLCDFTVDLAGKPRELRLEYGSEVKRIDTPPIRIELREGFPLVDAGRIRLDRGLWFDRTGEGDFVPILDEQALAGAFVVREDGRRYRMPAEARYTVEEQGQGKVVIRREGWYVGDTPEDRFCLFITRYLLQRDSPLVRIFHTWIFTGDGNRERIANMGWAFPMAEGLENRGFLTSFDETDTWTAGSSLLQYDYETFAVEADADVREYPGGRAPGVARAEGNGVRLLFGARDFWQNYPSELEFMDGTLWFHNWPRRNRPAAYTFEGEIIMDRGEPALPSRARHAQVRVGRLTRSEWKLNLVQARFAHEGELLDFRLPDEVAEDPIWYRTSLGTGNINWLKGQPETANAQGISRTEELWLHLSASDTGAPDGVRFLRGLNRETLRATVDPAWVAASGAFYEIHPKDPETYPDEERVFDLIAKAPGRWIEHLGLYGMWIYGDIAAWRLQLERREPDVYRAFRKGHQGWPYSWVPFARSGDPELLRLADAATRQNIDANYCHYYTEDVDEQSGRNRFRRRGRWQRSTLPWASRIGPTSRCYESQCDYLWHAWYLTGYHRAREHVLDWAVETKNEENLLWRGPISLKRNADHRFSLTLQKSYLDMYEATFDPWFLVATHALADGHIHQNTIPEGWSAHGIGDTFVGRSHFWRTADRDYLRFTGCEDYRAHYLAYADVWGSHNEKPAWTGFGAPMIEGNAHAWRLTGKEYYLRRVARYLEWPRVFVLDNEQPEYRRGSIIGGQTALFIGWYLQYFPLALGVLEEAGHRPEPVYDSFIVQAQPMADAPDGESRYRTPDVLIQKEAGKALPLSFSAATIPTRMPEGETYTYAVTGPDGTLALSGSWRLRDRCRIVLPAEAPAGTYRLHVEGASQRGIEVPVSPVGTPEVIALAPGQQMPIRGIGGATQFWFRVPENRDSFTVEILPESHRDLRRVSIWGPDGECAWDRQLGKDESDETIRAVVDVAPGQAGRLWRITLPQGGAFTMGPEIPPVWAVNPERWFVPQGEMW